MRLSPTDGRLVARAGGTRLGRQIASACANISGVVVLNIESGLALAAALNDALPQMQCTRCGFPDCEHYAKAMAFDAAAINRCPPGGREGIERLSLLTGRPAVALDPDCGTEAPRQLAVIDEAWCIGCTLCLAACPVDCIVGGPKRMHTVIDARCTGCELCVPACPVDCISLLAVTGNQTGWQAWNASQADEARNCYDWHRRRLQRDEAECSESRAGSGAGSNQERRSVIDTAVARARALREV